MELELQVENKPDVGIKEQFQVELTKKGRSRKKLKYTTIREQMEFYFSDSNLAKERFLNNLISENPYVPLTEFLKFNKIKALTTEVKDISQALSNSEFLTLSEDRLSVKRNKEFVAQNVKDVDELTIYVESLPRTANHDWVKNVFSAYGNVNYVSLPKYKVTNRIKEFGFVEFADKIGVEQVINAFKLFGGFMSVESTEPETLLSITSFNKENNNDSKGENTEQISENKNTEELCVEQSNEENIVEAEDEMPPQKRLKMEPDTSEITNSDVDNTENEMEISEVPTTMQMVDERPEELSKKTKKKSRVAVKENKPVDDKLYDMKIMTKKNWKSLRNKYLNMQREKYKELKKVMIAGRKTTNATKKTSSLKTIKASPKNINFYGALPEKVEEPEKIELNKSRSKKEKPLVAFEPGVIVNLKFSEPCVDIKEFKMEMRQYSYVKYVDIKEGDCESFIRVDKASSANLLVKQYSSAEYKVQILSGETEKNYWDKIGRDREQKINKTVKVKQERGREKLMKKIKSHIRFEDD